MPIVSPDDDDMPMTGSLADTGQPTDPADGFISMSDALIQDPSVPNVVAVVIQLCKRLSALTERVVASENDFDALEARMTAAEDGTTALDARVTILEGS